MRLPTSRQEAVLQRTRATRRERWMRWVRPTEQFQRTESSGGIVLLLAAVAALALANSIWSDSYFDFVDAHLAIDLGFYELDEPVHFWVNDGLMVLFFFLVGMEIKRELYYGELAERGRVWVPVAAAVGGMAVPVAVFFAVAGTDAGVRDGWAIPMATDIAFALGVMALLGDRVSAGLKALLLAVAIVDDIGAILVIALFFTDSIDVGALLATIAFVAVAGVMNISGVWRISAYVVVAAAAWAAAVKSGVHPTVVGVALGLMTPTSAWFRAEGFVQLAREMLDRFAEGVSRGVERMGHELRVTTLVRLRELTMETIAPLDRLEHLLHPWSAFLIVPLFAFVNAGVDLGGDTIPDALSSKLSLGIFLGLVVGKPLGLLLGAWVATRLGATLPPGVAWRDVLGIGILAGIGFTMSLFITELAFEDEALIIDAKVGIFFGSIVAGVAGYVVLRSMTGAAAPVAAAAMGDPAGGAPDGDAQG